MFPQTISIGPVPLSAYGFLVTLGFFLGIWLGSWLAARYEKIEKTIVWDLGITITVAALLGAKLLLIFTDPNFYRHPGNILTIDFLRSGGVFYGGFLASLAWSVYYFRRHKLPAWKMADALAPGVALGHALGRIGCHTAGCCHGRESHSFLHVTFTDVQSMVKSECLNVPVYPTQLIEAVGNILLVVFLVGFYRKKKFDGQIVLLYAMIYAILRFAVEFLRGDERGWVISNMISTSQFISLLIFPCALFFYLKLHRRARPVVG